jgi:hypothetical protein
MPYREAKRKDDGAASASDVLDTAMNDIVDRERLDLQVKLMAQPCLWRWDIKDSFRGSVVQSSWDDEWAAYASHDEAYAAGRERLEQIVDTRRSSRPASEDAPAPGSNSSRMPRVRGSRGNPGAPGVATVGMGDRDDRLLVAPMA